MNTRPKLEAEFAGRLLPVARAWRRAADRALAQHGLSSAGAWSLIHIARLGGHVRQAELAQALEIEQASLVRVARQLDEAGLIERVNDAEDRRALRLSLTKDGRQLVERIEAVLQALRADLLDGVSDQELAAAVRVVDRVATRMSNGRDRT